MANYAHVVGNEIVGLYDILPRNLENISNFDLLTPEEIKHHGFHTIIKAEYEIDPETQEALSPTYSLVNGYVIEAVKVVEKTTQLRDVVQQWEDIRQQRDTRIKEIMWRYERNSREQRMGLPVSDDISRLDQYVQSLANITQHPDPFNILWPVYGE